MSILDNLKSNSMTGKDAPTIMDGIVGLPAEMLTQSYEAHFNNTSYENLDEVFVKTSLYKKALSALEETNIVILIGLPGIGKTITSKMISQDYFAKGYKILYSEEGNIDNAQGLLNVKIPSDNTLFILNDFLGQFYTALKYSDLSIVNQLVKSLRTHDNVKLLINTRGIIYQEAMSHDKFSDIVDNEANNISEIQMNELELFDRAMILHNHLKRAYMSGNLSAEHYMSLISDRNYMKIILDERFNPRIIEHVTKRKILSQVEPHNYFSVILNTLENPSKVWEKEYSELDFTDRICLNTLFSLTNTNVALDTLKECFNNRIKVAKKDTTINYFNDSIRRLSESMVSIVISNEVERIGVINPSVNDYLRSFLEDNENETDEIIKYSLFYEQIDRLMPYKKTKRQLVEQMNSGILLNLRTFPKQTFTNMDMEFYPPNYLYIYKILLIYFNESDIKNCGLQKQDIQNFTIKIFENNYNDIEANSRLYFAGEFAEIFFKLFSNSSCFDLTEIVNNEKYLNVVLNSINKHESFWELITDIQGKYFSCLKDKFYSLASVQSCVSEKITSEVIDELYSEIISTVSDEIEDCYDDLEELEYLDDVAEYVLQAVIDDVFDLITKSIQSKLRNHGIDFIDDDYFDVAAIISDDFNVTDMIEQEYEKKIYSDSDDFKENVQKLLEDIVSLFEDISWFAPTT